MRLCMLMLLHGHCTGHVCTVDDCEVGFKPNIAALYGLLDLTMSCMSEMAINKTLTQVRISAALSQRRLCEGVQHGIFVVSLRAIQNTSLGSM